MAAPSKPQQPDQADRAEKRSIVVAGAGVFGALVLLVIIAIVFSGGAGDPVVPSASTLACAPGDEVCRAAQQSAERPGIIPRPGEGTEPSSPGDRGGWAQFALFGLIVAALLSIAAVITRSARRARRAVGPAGPGDGTAASGPS